MKQQLFRCNFFFTAASSRQEEKQSSEETRKGDNSEQDQRMGEMRLTKQICGAEVSLNSRVSLSCSEIPLLLWYLKLCYCFYKILSSGPILNPVYTITLYFSESHFNIIHQSTVGSPQWSLTLIKMC
jgi:hypothetical protein